jgi:hypothetical protein
MLTARSVDGWLIGTILAFCSLADPVSAASRSEAVVVNGVPIVGPKTGRRRSRFGFAMDASFSVDSGRPFTRR